jgi:hypothetical protein
LEFASLEYLNETLRKWSCELDAETYLIRLNEAVSEVTQVLETVHSTEEQILLSLCEVGRDTHQISPSSREQESGETYGLKSIRLSRTLPRTRKLSRQQSMVNKWGEEGRQCLQINCAQNWTKSATRLAKAVPDYREVMSTLSVHRLRDSRQ